MNSLKKVITSLMATLMIICAFGGSVFAASLNGWVKSKYGGWYYYKNGERLTSQWLKDGSYWYYLDEDGIMLSDSETYIGDKYYGFDEDGHWYYSCDFNDKGEKLFYDLSGKTVFVRCSKEDGWYYYDGSMYPLRGWVKLFDEWYYCDNNGKAAVGWRDIGGSRYYFDSEGIMYSGGIWEFVDEDTRYCFDDNGKLRTGWFILNEYWFYADESGKIVEGWNKIDGKWYFFYWWGMSTGYYWDEDDADKVYFLADSGEMLTGWIELDGFWIYADASGCLLTDWQRIGGEWYYFDGYAMVTGWKRINYKWYYFNEDGHWISNVEQAGWKQEGNDWYYYSSGVRTTGWKQIDGFWYYFDTDGRMVREWRQIGGKWYFFDERGAMCTGLVISDGKYYLCEQSGAMVSTPGWQKISYDFDGYHYDYWYLIENGGRVVTGWKKINGYWYYFDAYMLYDTVMVAEDDTIYGFDIDGHMITGWYYDGFDWMFFNEDGRAAIGWKEISGVWYYFDEYGWMFEDTTENIGGIDYKFDINGHCTNPYG